MTIFNFKPWWQDWRIQLRLHTIQFYLLHANRLLKNMDSDIQALNDQIAKNNSDATAAASEISNLKTVNVGFQAQIKDLTDKLDAAPSAAEIQAATAAAKTTSDTLENAV